MSKVKIYYTTGGKPKNFLISTYGGKVNYTQDLGKCFYLPAEAEPIDINEARRKFF